jgi:hypothetical protein
MDPLDPVRAFVRNGWNLDYVAFCNHTGLDTLAADSKRAFRHFQDASDHLRQLPDAVLRVLVVDPPAPAPRGEE